MTNVFYQIGINDGMNGREPYPPNFKRQDLSVFSVQYMRGYRLGRQAFNQAEISYIELKQPDCKKKTQCQNCEGLGYIDYNPNLNPNSFPGHSTAKCTRCNGTGFEE